MSIERDRAEGNSAIDLKGNAAFTRAVILARAKIVEQWMAAKTVDEREALHVEWHAIGRVLTQLDVVEGRGHIAQAELNRQAKPA